MGINRTELQQFIELNMVEYHDKLLSHLRDLKLKKVLKRKNPYLFKAKSLETSESLVKSVLEAYLSSREETVFGDFLEKLAIFVCGQIYNGKKSTAEGIDLEFEKESIYYLVSIKSGPNWGNSSQIKK